MSTILLSRRLLALRLAAIPVGAGLSAGVLGASRDGESAAAGDGLSHAAESIRQVVEFDANPVRVYEALTDAKQFDAVTRLSDAVKLVTAPGAKPTSISRAVGGAFTLFGGYITGRHLEMVRGERLVQAWRAASWKPGDFSVVKFLLQANGAGTKVLFDHRGFPEGRGPDLADGWHTHYWDPLAKFLSSD